MSDNLPVQISNCELSKTGAIIRDGLDMFQWLAIGHQMAKVADCIQWWIGDWANYGISKYGDKSQKSIEAGEAFAMDPETVRKYAWAAGKVVNRLTSLSWAHHYVVAGLEKEDQQKFLVEAVTNQWSVADLRQAIRAANGVLANVRQDGGFNFIKGVGDLVRWFSLKTEEVPIDQWEPERRAEVKSRLQPIVELWQRL